MHALMHHLNRTNLAQAFGSLRAGAASGIDHVSKADYKQDLERKLARLEERLRQGNWVSKPAREVLIPKPQGGTRPLAIGCIEDKIVQTLTARILEAIYEPIFHRHSYGFRKNKSAHQALGRLYSVINERKKSCVVVEMDIEKFFNSVSRQWLVGQLEKKIADKRFLNLIQRLLDQSVLQADGQLAETTRGTPQGSPVSPVLANICLHYLLDEWFQKNWASKGQFVRYADDAVFVFTSDEDAKAFHTQLQARMAEASLALNIDKSGIIPFSASNPQGTIGFLGFELYWGRRAGARTLKVKTQAKKLHRGIDAFVDWLKRTRNRLTTTKLLAAAAAKIRGHFNYFSVMWNEAKLNHFRYATTGALFRWMNRRSQKRSLSWAKFKRKLEQSPIPPPPSGKQLRDICSEMGSVRNHQLKSRMRKLRTSGSVRSAGLNPAFT
jgi:group II intron reverse transcriptase/maturase